MKHSPPPDLLQGGRVRLARHRLAVAQLAGGVVADLVALGAPLAVAPGPDERGDHRGLLTPGGLLGCRGLLTPDGFLLLDQLHHLVDGRTSGAAITTLPT
ncbi:unnamed protein product [Prorocentrum cordatum]|uniref:Uncharacterized protein n=1 Tax=Prorocentrum cordatum TaxID=2364126 RepID=A0ABN9X2I4_9DINO|nr:unnamed protein product [Polarella glacialis]